MKNGNFGNVSTITKKRYYLKSNIDNYIDNRLYTGNELQAILMDNGLLNFNDGYIPFRIFDDIETSTIQLINNNFIIPTINIKSPLFKMQDIEKCISKLKTKLDTNNKSNEYQKVISIYQQLVTNEINTNKEKYEKVQKLSQKLKKKPSKEYIKKVLSYTPVIQIERLNELYESALIKTYGY